MYLAALKTVALPLNFLSLKFHNDEGSDQIFRLQAYDHPKSF